MIVNKGYFSALKVKNKITPNKEWEKKQGYEIAQNPNYRNKLTINVEMDLTNFNLISWDRKLSFTQENGLYL